MDSSKRIILTLIIGIILVITFYFITSAITKFTGFSVSEKPLEKEQAFKNCLKEKNIVLYINSENTAETLKSIILFNYLDSVKIFNCKNNNKICIENEINGPFPTWFIENKKIFRDISISELSENSRCNLI